LTYGNASHFSDWAKNLRTPSIQTTFFNFTASHDGIGVRPLEGILSSTEISKLVDRIRRNGGKVSEMDRPSGSKKPYELNITYLDALKDPGTSKDPLHIDRFLASQAVAMVLPGVPAVYIHSLLGSQNWLKGVQETGRARSINRERLQTDAVSNALADSRSVRSRIFYPYLNMIRIRTRQPAFHPRSRMQILDLDDRVFAVKRTSSQQGLLALTNFSMDTMNVRLSDSVSPPLLTDLFTGRQFRNGDIPLRSYETLWLTDTVQHESPSVG
jgi:sucrose phosphorylase